MSETKIRTNHMDSAAACCLVSTASSLESHQLWDHFCPVDHLEAWTCTSTDTQLRSSDISAMNGGILRPKFALTPLRCTTRSLFFYFHSQSVHTPSWNQFTISLTCHWQMCTSAASLLWTSSTGDSLSAGRGSCRWTRWCHRSQRPAWWCTGHRSTPPSYRLRSETVCTPGSSSFPAHGEYVDLRDTSE